MRGAKLIKDLVTIADDSVRMCNRTITHNQFEAPRSSSMVKGRIKLKYTSGITTR